MILIIWLGKQNKLFFEINEMDVVHDYEIVSDVLKLYISSENDEMSKYTLLFVHLKSGKIIGIKGRINCDNQKIDLIAERIKIFN